MIWTEAAVSAHNNSEIGPIIVGWCSLSTTFHHHMAQIVHAYETLLPHYQFKMSRSIENSLRMERDYHGQRWTAWSLSKEGVKVSIIHRRLSAVCGDRAHASSTVFNWVRSGKGTAQAGSPSVIPQHP